MIDNISHEDGMSETKTPTICMIGSSNMDLVVYAPRIPAPAETLHGSRFETGFGGKGANQAVMAAKLGANVTVITKLGRDSFGEATLANYRAHNINTDYILFDETRSSGVALITVDETTGQNNIVIVGGANDALSPADVEGARTAIYQADVVICQLETPIATTLRAFQIARAANITTILNPAPASPLPAELLAVTDWLIPNEIEASMLTGGTIRSREQMETAALALKASGPQGIVITMGEQGALLVGADNIIVEIPVAHVKAVDTTGAGDAFVGSFAYFLALGALPTEAVRRACAIAARSVLKAGAQSSYPTRKEVLSLLK